MAIKYKWLSADNPTSSKTVTNGWTYQANAVTDGWVASASKSINVNPNEPVIVEYSGGGSLVPVAVKDTGAAAYKAGAGESPALLAKVVNNVATTEKYEAYYFKAPAYGFGYLAFKDASSSDKLYLGLKINVDISARPRTFASSTDLLTDAGDRYTGSISRTYPDIGKQWDDFIAASTTLNQNQLIDEVAVKASTKITATDPLPEVRGAFSVVVGSATYCSEYTSASFVDSTTSTTKLNKATLKAIKPWGHLSLLKASGTWETAAGATIYSETAKELQTAGFAYSWQIPDDAPVGDVYYVGLKCTLGAADYVAAW